VIVPDTLLMEIDMNMFTKRQPAFPDHRGFALPGAIFALVVVAFLVTGGIHLATQESRIGFATEQGAQAFYVAEAGLEQVLATVVPPPMAVWGASTVLTGQTPQGGEWQVRMSRVEDELYFVHSVGSILDGSGNVMARRQVGQLGRVFILKFNASGALTIGSGVHAQGVGTVPKVDGADNTDPLWATEWGAFCPPEADLPGVVSDNAADVTCAGGPPGCTAQYQGSPPIQEDPAAVQDQWDEINDQWDDFVAAATNVVAPGTYSPAPAIEIDPNGDEWCDTSVLLNWGNPELPTATCGGHFPLIYVPGNLSLTGSGMGQGILLVEGDLSMVGTTRFDGIVLVRGNLSAASGTPTIHGSVLAGGAGNLSGTAGIHYSSCALSIAINQNASATVRPVQSRGWVDLTSASF
jgi:hypothetical protein